MRMPPVFASLVLLLALFPARLNADPVQTVAPGRLHITVDGHDVCIPAISSHAMTQELPQITRAIILNPHYQRETVEVFDLLANAAQDHGVSDQTLIVGLQYLVATDVLYHDLPDDILYWMLNTWQWGDESSDLPALPRPVTVSSYSFIDSAAYRIADICPNLEVLVVTGQSAGGGLTQRYAAGSTLPGEFDRFAVTFVSTCLGHFMYMNEERRELGTNNVFSIPPDSAINQCQSYDSYPYGLEDLNSYMAVHGAQTIRQRFRTRWFAYITGSLDNQLLPTFCPVLFQGFTRVQRHRVYWNYLNYFYGPGIRNRQRLFIIEGVGHSTFGIYSSAVGRFFLFDWNPTTVYGTDPFAQQVSTQASHVSAETLQFSVHPNPFNEFLSISVDDHFARPLTVTLYDILGRQILRHEFHDRQASRTFSLDVSHLASGVYLVRVSSQGVHLASQKVALIR